jgi:hypothetical protein
LGVDVAYPTVPYVEAAYLLWKERTPKNLFLIKSPSNTKKGSGRGMEKTRKKKENMSTRKA